MGLYWKNMPSHAHNSREKKSAFGFKAIKDCLTRLFAGKAKEDIKLKTLF
jgi:hypothetical protein